MTTNKPKTFILEDDERRIALFEEAFSGHELTIARCLGGPQGAYKKFQPPYNFIFLDHDLGQRQMVSSDEEETGFQFVRWLGAAPQEGNAIWLSEPHVIVHSYNPDGALNMVLLLRENGWSVARIPFGQGIFELIGRGV